MKKLALLCILFLFEAKADPIKVAVIDSGVDLRSNWPTAESFGLRNPKFCKTGHRDFTTLLPLDMPFFHNDSIGHGTHVSGLIAKYAEDSDYCIVSYKYFTPQSRGVQSSIYSNRALKAAIKDRVDIINYSGGGLDKDDEECRLVSKAIDMGIIFIAAAGNEGLNLEERPYYPAMCDDRAAVVFNLNKDGSIAKSSNYSVIRSTKFQEVGMDVLSTMPGGSLGRMSGTSQATAIVTGKMVKRMAYERTFKKIKKRKK